MTGLLMFLSVSFLIAFFGDKTYGVWVLILSMFQWSLFFDFGISNVLKTKIPEFVVKNETANINEYITVSYILTGILAVLMFLALLLVVFSVNLSQFFNLPFEEKPIAYLIIVNGAFFCLNLVLSMNKSLFIGIDKNHISEQSSTISQLSFFLVMIFSISLFGKEESILKLYLITILNGFTTIAINAYYTYLFFKKNNYKVIPFEKADFVQKNKVLLIMGLKFMLIQCFMVIVFFSDPYLISHYLLPEETTKYDVITKLFQFPLLIILSALGPFWPLFSKKFHENDFEGIKKMFAKFHRVFMLITLGIVVLGLLSNHILFLWIHKIDYVPVLVIASVVFMTVFRVLFTFYANFFNGLGQLNSQIILMGIAALIKIPFSVFLFKNNFGIASVLISTCLFLLISSLFLFMQSKTILNGR